MADPLSVVAGVTGISVAYAQLANAIFTSCDRLWHATNQIRDVGTSMASLSTILDPLAHVLDKGQGLYTTQLLQNTKNILKQIRQVQKAVRKLVKEHVGVRARMNWAFFDLHKFNELSARIESLKSGLVLVSSTIQLAIAQEGRERSLNQLS